MNYDEVIRMTYDILVEPEDLKKITYEKLNYQLLDIRKDEDYFANHIETTQHCEWQEVPSYIETNKLKKDIPVVVICYTGQSSMQVATILRLKGYEAFTLHHGFEYYTKNFDTF